MQEVIIDKEESEYTIYDHQFPVPDNGIEGITEWFAKGNNFLVVNELFANKAIGYIVKNYSVKGICDILHLESEYCIGTYKKTSIKERLHS